MHFQANRANKALEGVARGCIVVNVEDDGSLLRHATLLARPFNRHSRGGRPNQPLFGESTPTAAADRTGIRAWRAELGKTVARMGKPISRAGIRAHLPLEH